MDSVTSIKWLPGAVRACGLLTCSLALAGIAGYSFDVAILRGVLPGAVEMKANTALALLLAGIALAMSASIDAGRASGARKLGQILSLLVAVLGIATLFEYAAGANLGIDELLVDDPRGPFTVHPGRMSPYSATAFLCIGVALFLQLRRSGRVALLLCAFTTSIVGLTSLLGYLLSASDITTDKWVPPVAIHSALAFALLGCGAIINARPALLLAAFEANSAKGVERKVLAGFLCALLLLGIGGSVSYRMQVNLATAAEQSVRLQAATASAITARIERQRIYSLIAMLVTLGFATLALSVLFGSIVRDMRARARIANELRKAQEDAQHATRTKSEFLAAMSHEIRTPMNGVIGMLDLLEQSSLLGPQREMVNLTRESADSLLGIIDGILDFSKIEAGRLEIERVPICIAEVVEKSCSLLNRLAERRGVTLRVFCDPAIPGCVAGDPMRLRQILLNLIGNAIKFSAGLDRHGEVAVRVLPGAGAHEVEFRVTDNGIGMSPAVVAKLFRSFTQADASTTRRYGGTGLGLAICKHLVELMDGSIEVQSSEHRGSTFTVRLAFEPARGAADPCASHPDIAGLPCLVLGEADGLADDLAAYLSAAQARVARGANLTAVSAWSAQQRSGEAVCLLVTAQEMPSVRSILAALPKHSELRVNVLLVALGRAQRAAEAEADGFGVIDGNGLTRQMLLAAVARAAGLGPAEQASPRPAAVPSRRRPARSRDEAILERRLILVAEDNDISQRLISEQLSLLGYVADVVGNGHDALQRWRSGDYALLFTDLHMPDRDGYDVTLAIRVAEGSGMHLPIIALTANALPGEEARCLAVGMDGYVTKPATLTEIAAVLDKWLPEDLTADPNAPTRAAPATPQATLNIAALHDFVGDDPAITRDLLRTFQSSSATAAHGIIEAIRARSCRGAMDFAHRLKSSALMFGAAHLGDLCQQIEAAGMDLQLGELQRLLPLFEAESMAVELAVAEALATPEIIGHQTA